MEWGKAIQHMLSAVLLCCGSHALVTVLLMHVHARALGHVEYKMRRDADGIKQQLEKQKEVYDG